MTKPPTVRLDSVCDVRLGRQRSPQHHTGTHMRPYMRAANVGWGGLRLDDVKTMNFTDAEMGTFRLCPGDLLLSEASGTATEVGKPAIWNGEVEDCGFQNTLLRVRSHGPEPRYLLHYFMHQAGTGRFAANSRGVGIHHLGREALASWLVPLPPIEEQRRIAAVLDKADDLRAKRRAALAQLDTLTESIFLDMFGDPSSNARGWLVSALADVVAPGTIVTYGIVQAGDEWPGGVPYIRTGDIVDGRIATGRLRRTDPAIAAKFARSRVTTGEIVMSIRATVGTTAFVTPDLDGANLTQGTARIAPGPDTEPWYLLAFLRSASAQHWIQKQVKGATFREITLTRLRELPVLVAPFELQLEFARRVAEVRNLADLASTGATQLDNLFASLQQRAFRGEL